MRFHYLEMGSIAYSTTFCAVQKIVLSFPTHCFCFFLEGPCAALYLVRNHFMCLCHGKVAMEAQKKVADTGSWYFFLLFFVQFYYYLFGVVGR